MVTVQQVFDTTIHLMDEQRDRDGGTISNDTDDYRRRTINILNMAIPLLWNICQNNTDREPGIELPTMLNPEPYSDPDFTQVLPLDDAFCYTILPLFLAHHLLYDEDAERSARYFNEYKLELATLQKNQMGQWEQITNPYADFSL